MEPVPYTKSLTYLDFPVKQLVIKVVGLNNLQVTNVFWGVLLTKEGCPGNLSFLLTTQPSRQECAGMCFLGVVLPQKNTPPLPKC
jgi:hypothetical protein